MATYIDALNNKHTDGSEQETQLPHTNTLLDTYLASGGQNCPFCNSYRITAEEFEDEGLTIFREIKCNDCGKKWDEVFQLEQIYEKEQ